MLKWRRKFSSPLLRWGTLMSVVFAVVAIFGDQGLLKLRLMNQHEAYLTGQINWIEGENERLTHEIELLEDRRYLEKIVREELGYLRPDEVVYYIEETRP